MLKFRENYGREAWYGRQVKSRSSRENLAFTVYDTLWLGSLASATNGKDSTRISYDGTSSDDEQAF